MKIHSTFCLSAKTQLQRLKVASRLVSRQEHYEFLLERANYFCSKGQYLDSLERYKEAIDLLQKVSKLSGVSLYPVSFGIGYCFTKLGNTVLAISFLNAARKQMPQEPETYKLLAFCHQANKNTKAEAEHLENYILRCESLNATDYSRLSILLNKEGTYPKAIEYGQKAINLFELNSNLSSSQKASEIVSLSLRLADAYLQYETPDSAIQFLESSITKITSLSNMNEQEKAELNIKTQSLQNKINEISQSSN